jgi:uncharacterized protein YndB with AHSA1/START domain
MSLWEHAMITFQTDVQFDRPVEQVFAYLTTSSNHPRWDFTAVEMNQKEPGAWHKGTHFHEVRNFQGRRMDIQSQIVVFEPNKRMEIQSLTEPAFLGTWIFTPVNGGSRLTYRAEMQYKGMMRLMEPLIRAPFLKQLDANFRNLKVVLETDTQPVATASG